MSYQGSTSAQARDTMEKAGDNLSSAAQAAADKTKSITHDVAEAVGQAGDMAQERLDAMATYVRRNPLQSTAIAAAVGFAFALIARR